MLWFSLVFLVLLKIPVVYLVYVVWWAVKDPPTPGEGAAGSAGGEAPNDDGPGWRRWRAQARAPLRRGPHGSPARRPAAAVARARTRTEA